MPEIVMMFGDDSEVEMVKLVMMFGDGCEVEQMGVGV